MSRKTFTKEAWSDYKSKLLKSNDAVWSVARYLHSFKHTITIPALHIADSLDQYKEHVDEGDIILHRNGNKEKIEVKHQSWNWTSHNDIPWNSIIVCAKKSYDRHKEKPSAYFLVNQQLSHALVVSTQTYHSWVVKDIHDKQKDWVQTMYMIDPKRYEFKEII